MIACSREELWSLAVIIHAARATRTLEIPHGFTAAQGIQAEVAYCVSMALAIIKEAEERLAEQ